ncbi:hypothetical protein FAI41_01930 [Acetobacteraceae bacterium]|nr:hypothetical protein FAI41_01930 [Acetobacteraceae bacterium]
MDHLQDKWLHWICLEAAPLWASAGFNSSLGLFHERLTFSGEACDPPALRLMSQARQVASFATLARFKEGQKAWGNLALSVMARLEKLYHQRDGGKGWIFSLDQKAEISDRKRDLYGHAFVLFAYASLGKLLEQQDKAEFSALKQKSLVMGQEIFTLFGVEDEKGHFQEFQAWREVLPFRGEHAQNPWMHLLESCLSLFEVFGDKIWKERAKVILKLLRVHLLTPEGILPEKFNETWRSWKKIGKNPIEPGHLIEWRWLLGEARRLLDLEHSEEIHLIEIAEGFSAFAEKYGRSSQKESFLVNAVLENGRVADPAMRLWPQTEYLRLLASPHVHLAPEKVQQELIAQSEMFFTHFIPSSLKGGWIDRLTKEGRQASSEMPATSFYHILSAVLAISARK